MRLTHPDRVLYPDDGFTKRDLAEYYERVADWILPYVVDRPLTLVRCPEGHTGECFFQKHLTGTLPDAVHGVTIKEKGKKEEYVAIDDLAGLVSLVQMGVLELHPWPAREDNVERPDHLVFDLDPGEGVDLERRRPRRQRDARTARSRRPHDISCARPAAKACTSSCRSPAATTWDEFKRSPNRSPTR